MNDTIAILSDSLIDLDKTSTDYMIIEEQLKNKNPEFDIQEKSLRIELPKFKQKKLITILFEIIERYGLTYYQIWTDKKDGQYTKGVSIEAVREDDQVSIKAVQPLLGYNEELLNCLNV
uniref:Uncharacterized protein n=3 Tax=Enterococcus TaxID=1350 RepID=B5U8W5_ENTFC|nr:hypothetical protein [Enterococcus faecium]BAG74966.1 hypothetical protein [Enterococcus faecium]